MLPLERRALLLRAVPDRREELFRADLRDDVERRERDLDPPRIDVEREERLRPADLRAVVLREELLLLRERPRDPVLRERELELDLRAAIASPPSCFQTRVLAERVALRIRKVASRNGDDHRHLCVNLQSGRRNDVHFDLSATAIRR